MTVRPFDGEDKLLLEESLELLSPLPLPLCHDENSVRHDHTPLVLPPYFPLVPSCLPSSPRYQLLLSAYDHIREGRTLHPESGQVSQSFKHRPHPPRDIGDLPKISPRIGPRFRNPPWLKRESPLASINYPHDYFLPGGSPLRDLDKLAKRCAQRRHC